MIAQPPERKPHVKPRRGADSSPPPPEDRPRTTGQVALTRAEMATDLAERRRRRRLKQAADDNMLPPIAIPRGMPFRIYVSWRWFSAAIVIALLVVLYLFFTRDFFYIHEIYVGGTKYLTPSEIFE